MATHQGQPVEDKTLIDSVDEAARILRSTPDRETHFARDLEWLARHRDFWRGCRWRVGLIGITSSGKSKLVNALLGESLLPSRVAPSSNVLVLCGAGPKRRAVVHFEDGRIEVVDRGIVETICRLTDEQNNPENTAGIREVELYTPQFRLGPQVVLVDTPGLDAYELEGHEKLTMEFFLPTVDVVIYLTTVKANADAQVRGFLERVIDAGKPLVLAQNMIDAVEPERGDGGRLRRTRQQVLETHVARLRRLLAFGPSNGSGVPIVQVSATDALAGRIEASRIDVLVETILRELATLRPKLASSRRRQLAAHLHHLCKQEALLRAAPAVGSSLEEERKRLTRLEVKLSLLGQFPSDLPTVQEARKEARALVRRVKSLGSEETAAAECLRIEVEGWRSEIANGLVQGSQKLRKSFKALGGELNVREDDLTMDVRRDRTTDRLDVATRTKVSRTRREKAGLWSGVKRFLGADSGWEDVPTKSTSLDTVAFSAAVEATTKQELAWLDQANRQFAEVISTNARILGQAVADLRADLDHKAASQFAAHDRSAARREIEVLATELERDAQAIQPSTACAAREAGGAGRPTVEVVVPTYVRSLLALSDRIARRRFVAARVHCIERLPRSATVRPLIWGWDASALRLFVGRFWHDEVHPDVVVDSGGHGFVAAKSRSAGDILVVNEGGAQGLDRDSKAFVEAFCQRSVAAFVLLDAMQQGSTRSQLSRSLLRLLPRVRAHVILVVQSVEDLRNAEQIVEGLIGVFRTARDFSLNSRGVLANDDQIAATVLFDRLHTDGQRLHAQTDETEWLRELDALPGHSEGLPDVLRAWRRWHCAEGALG